MTTVGMYPEQVASLTCIQHQFSYHKTKPKTTDLKTIKSENVERLLSEWTSQKRRADKVTSIIATSKPKKCSAAAKKKEMNNRKCYNCKTSTTRQWVRGEDDDWLCHACGQYWRMNGCHRRESLWHRPTFTRRRKSNNKKKISNKRKTSVAHCGVQRGMIEKGGASPSTQSLTSSTPTHSSMPLTPTHSMTSSTPTQSMTTRVQPVITPKLKPLVFDSFNFAPRPITATSPSKPDPPRLEQVRPLLAPPAPLPSFHVHFAKLCA